MLMDEPREVQIVDLFAMKRRLRRAGNQVVDPVSEGSVVKNACTAHKPLRDLFAGDDGTLAIVALETS